MPLVDNLHGQHFRGPVPLVQIAYAIDLEHPPRVHFHETPARFQARVGTQRQAMRQARLDRLRFKEFLGPEGLNPRPDLGHGLPDLVHPTDVITGFHRLLDGHTRSQRAGLHGYCTVREGNTDIFSVLFGAPTPSIVVYHPESLSATGAIPPGLAPRIYTVLLTGAAPAPRVSVPAV